MVVQGWLGAVSSIADLTWLRQRESGLGLGSPVVPAPSQHLGPQLRAVEDSPPFTPLCLDKSTDHQSHAQLCSLSVKWTSQGGWRMDQGHALLGIYPQENWPSWGTRLWLQGPLPGLSSCLVMPSPDDRSSMSRGSAEEQQGHLLFAVQLLHPLGRGWFSPTWPQACPRRAGSEWKDACWMAAMKYWGIERKARKGGHEVR